MTPLAFYTIIVVNPLMLVLVFYVNVSMTALKSCAALKGAGTDDEIEL